MSQYYTLVLILSCACSSVVSPVHDAGDNRDVATDAPADRDAPSDLDATADTQISDMRQRRDTRPEPAPEWIPPFPIADDIGWRDSDEPFCNEFIGHHVGHHVWADARGVFVLDSVLNNSFNPGDPETPPGATLWHNDGTGWQAWWRTDLPAGERVPTHMTGAEGASIYLGGGGCLVRQISGPGSVRCALSALRGEEAGSFMNLAVMAENRGWILTSRHLFRQGDDDWFQSGVAPRAGHDLSISNAYRAVLSLDGLFFGGTENYFRRDDAPDMAYSSMWIGSLDDIWLGSFEGGNLIHFDGVQWNIIDSGITGRRPSIRHLWSRDGEEIFYASANALGSWSEASGARIIAQWDDHTVQISDIHGNPEGELFITVDRGEFLSFECGSGVVLWYDGVSLRRF